MKNTKVWIIGCSGSEWDDVYTYRVTGTKAQVKSHLASLVRESKQQNRESFDYGDTSAKTVTERPNGVLYAGITFRHCHEDYTATLDRDPIILGEKES